MSKDFYKEFLRMQKLVQSFNEPNKRMQEQIIEMNKLWLSTLEQYNLISNIDPMLEAIRSQQAITNQAVTYLMNPIHEQLRQLQETLVQMTSVQDFSARIPDVIYPQLSVLTSRVSDLLPNEEHEDLTGTITVKQPKEEITEPKWTWGQLISFLFIVIQILQPFYLDHQSSLQSATQHQELLDQDELQHIELLEQRERHHQETLEAMNSLMEFISPYLPDDQDTTESENEDPVTPD